MKKCSLLFLVIVILQYTFYVEASDNGEIIDEIHKIKTRFNIPAVAFGVVSSDSVLLQGAIGVREIYTDDSVTLDDYFHIGSLGKAVTSFIAGKLVDDSLISWNTRFFDLFPELIPTSHPDYHNIELKDLLSHRAKIIPFKGASVLGIVSAIGSTFNNDYYSNFNFAKYILTLEPVKLDSNESYKYSNAGYTLAALMLEKSSGHTYDELIEKINRDLDLHFHVGWPRSLGNNQPNGHLIPSEAGYGNTDTLIVMPESIFYNWEAWRIYQYYCKASGDLSISIIDYLKFLQLNIRGLKGESNYLKSETYDYIFNGMVESSMGWGNFTTDGYSCYNHSGSLVTFYCYVHIIKELNIGFVIMANSGNGQTIGGVYTIKDLFLNQYAK